jgi:hypothetical protein
MNVAAHAVTRTVMVRGDTQIEVLAQGEGPLTVLLPSLGRGAADFDVIGSRLAEAGIAGLAAGTARDRAEPRPDDRHRLA